MPARSVQKRCWSCLCISVTTVSTISMPSSGLPSWLWTTYAPFEDWTSTSYSGLTAVPCGTSWRALLLTFSVPSPTLAAHLRGTFLVPTTARVFQMVRVQSLWQEPSDLVMLSLPMWGTTARTATSASNPEKMAANTVCILFFYISRGDMVQFEPCLNRGCRKKYAYQAWYFSMKPHNSMKSKNWEREREKKKKGKCQCLVFMHECVWC